ncbi:MAG: polysaccharide export protein EpsE [Burkholderiales bacterium]|nr:polysaccharide export protein EpsE [Burkholderiales bacterium]
MLLRVFKLFLFLFAVCGAASANAQARDYLLGPGDVISVKVFQSPDLSVDARVSEAGTIPYPLIGDLPVAGLTASAAGSLIAKRLAEGNFVKQPYVTVGIAQFRSVQVSVLGQVARPGKYPMEQSASRVTDVLAIAGGALPAAADAVWLVTHEGDKTRKVEIDIPAIMQAGDLSTNVLVKNGDTIFVPRAPAFYIYGEVQRPGQYRIERGMNATQALAVGGGPNPRGTDRGMRLSRRDAGGELVMREAKPDEPILPDDVLYVRERIF